MTMRVSVELPGGGSSSELLYDGYPYILFLEHLGGRCTFQGFDNFDDALAKYKRHPHNKKIYVVHTLVPSKQVLEA